MRLYYIISLSVLCFFMHSCKNPATNEKETVVQKQPVKIPAFSQDSAYVYLEKQLSFGPRNPGSVGHVACKDWMVEKLRSFGADVIAQNFTADYYTGDSYPAWNIVAQFNPEKKKRVILSAHWDTRFVAEQDDDEDMRDKPIPGADDGGSGTAVLIELGRVIQNNPIDLGVDIILWDAEDQGKQGPGMTRDTWCLGSQYWSRNKHKKNYKAKYGINLDMIGGKNPRFPKEFFSKKYAGQLQDKLWQLAQNMGNSDMFVNEELGQITDDHVFVNEIAKIPMIDVINFPASTNSFIKEWHTHDDDIGAIDKRSLRVVGQVMTAAIYKESTGHF